ncbi:MAG: hypothetical protein ACK4LB_15625 [Spirosomataceae bacterium]
MTEHFHKHLDILQGLINRMAGNSSSCKNYCVTLVTGVLALDQVKAEHTLTGLALIPVVLFCFLDAYYLSLEWHFKQQFRELIKLWQEDKLKTKHLFTIQPSGKGVHGIGLVLEATGSYSIFPFYGALSLVIGVLICMSK